MTVTRIGVFLKTLMFDIEGVLIKDVVEDQRIINHAVIQNLIYTYQPDRIGLFSFALETSQDVKKYEYLFQFFESTFNINIDRMLIPCKMDILHSINTFVQDVFIARGAVSFTDFNELWTKERAFITWARQTLSSHILYVDDMISNCVLQYPECTITAFRFPLTIAHEKLLPPLNQQ